MGDLGQETPMEQRGRQPWEGGLRRKTLVEHGKGVRQLSQIASFSPVDVALKLVFVIFNLIILWLCFDFVVFSA